MQTFVDRALRAENTRDTATFAGYAQAAAVELKDFLQDGLDSNSLVNVDRGEVVHAIGAISQAVIDAEKVALGTDLSSMRQRVEDFKRALDEASGRVREALRLPSAGVNVVNREA
jgi:hypothetical protein